jgi:hypothetical protein
MNVADADQYRRKADECRQAAEMASNGVDKNDWLKLASEWLKLAEEGAPHGARGNDGA